MRYDGPRFWCSDLNPVIEEGLGRSLNMLVPIVDEEEGGIVAYAMSGFEEEIVRALNARFGGDTPSLS